jgi:glycerol-3-phosphate dehydrogenase
MQNIKDIFIIGGGINGTAIAADAAGRGLSVVLCEKYNLATGTSSASTKLIHGGLRYLEFYEFNLVRKALNERSILIKRAPNLIQPQEFVFPHEKHLRPFWLMRLGLFLYDHLSFKNKLPHTKIINFEKNVRGKALQNEHEKGFSYYDAATDDARLVILNALSAKEHNATILTHTQFISAKRLNDYWEVKTHDGQQEIIYHAKILINAAGPWVSAVQQHIQDSDLKFNVKLVKGSHIVVPKLYEGDYAYLLQYVDQRVIFAIPFHDQFTLIGTTDIPFNKNLDDVQISEEEIHYLCNVINHYFHKKIHHRDIVWSYAGVRCLQDTHTKNPSKITRDYKILIEKKSAPLVTVIGGKITTHRDLADEVLNSISGYFKNIGKSWTANAPLPGGNFEKNNFANFITKFKQQYAWLPENILQRYAKNYGTRSFIILKNASSLEDLGIEFGAGLFQREVEYLINNEWAKTVDDILWRNTKLGLFLSAAEKQKLISWLDKKSTS